MAELSPIPLPDLLRRMRDEAQTTQAIFDLPFKKWYVPDPELDLSVRHFGRRAATPVGPAAGPHTQLAQNIVLSWLAGSRIIELKTVQINDRLEIPRPCIQVPNIGFNVEWSQELLVEQSAREYAKAVFLIEVLKKTHAFGLLDGAHSDGVDPATFDTIYDLSVGYDLEGIQSPKVDGFISSMRQPGALFDELREELSAEGDLTEFRDLELPPSISDCVTLSTFHGCPADQIEAISRHLVENCGLDTIVKLNPTLLGFERVREILHDRLGYTHLELDRKAFEVDLQYDDGLTILRRLRQVAERHGTEIGAKFSNTLVVRNKPDLFPTQSDPYMYVSGQPLHVLAMNLMQQFREDLGFELPVSFSAGIDSRNFASAVACGMAPITTCTDLLRQGGYGRLPVYLQALAKEMRKAGVTSRENYILAVDGHGDSSGNGDLSPQEALRRAGRLNGRRLVPGLVEDSRYHAQRNAKTPRRIDKELATYDCINCDLCIPACPNDAVFAYDATPVDSTTIRYSENDQSDGSGFLVREHHQLGIIEQACNACSNCETWCPENGAPFLVKELFFSSLAAFDSSEEEGFYHDGRDFHARLEGWRLLMQPVNGRVTLEGRQADSRVQLTASWPGADVLDVDVQGPDSFDTALLWRLKTAWHSVIHAQKPNTVRDTVRPQGEPS